MRRLLICGLVAGMTITSVAIADEQLTDQQIINRRPDAEMLLGFINRQRQAK